MRMADDREPVRTFFKQGSGVCGHLSHVFAVEFAKSDYLETYYLPAPVTLTDKIFGGWFSLGFGQRITEPDVERVGACVIVERPYGFCFHIESPIILLVK